MITRLQAIKATKASIKHLIKDIREPLQRGKMIDFGVFSSDNCALCILTDYKGGCDICPLFWNDHGCGSIGKEWHNFNNNRTTHNATLMIYALKDTLAWLEQGGGNYE